MEDASLACPWRSRSTGLHLSLFHLDRSKLDTIESLDLIRVHYGHNHRLVNSWWILIELRDHNSCIESWDNGRMLLQPVIAWMHRGLLCHVRVNVAEWTSATLSHRHYQPAR